jgi:hypothetical protein
MNRLTNRRQGWPRRWWGQWFLTAAGFPTVLAIVSAVTASRPVEVQQAWRSWASTNLANLGDHPVRAFIVSAFLPEGDPLAWVVLAAVGLGATGWVLGFWRTTILVAASHLIGTLVSEGIVAALIHRGERPVSARFLMDVGPSYIVVCALVAGVVYSRWPGRVVACLGFALLAPNLFGGLAQLEVAPVGHVCAVIVGIVGGSKACSRRQGRRRPVSRFPNWGC